MLFENATDIPVEPLLQFCFSTVILLQLTIMICPAPGKIVSSETFFRKIIGLGFGRKQFLDKSYEGTLAYLGCMGLCGFVVLTILEISPIILIFSVLMRGAIFLIIMIGWILFFFPPISLNSLAKKTGAESYFNVGKYLLVILMAIFSAFQIIKGAN